VSATNLIGFYITLEALSLLSYGIIAYSRDISASEAAMKYYIYGVIASALLIYGLSVQYKLYGTLLYDEIHLESLINDPSTPQLIVFICVGSAFLYKLSLFPFHFTLPDVYQAIPWYTILIINLTIKISIMLAFLRF
jgi:NADH-quinone oxidoreductase subunit N